MKTTGFQTSNQAILWARETERKGQPMKLIGAWADILAYYQDANGDVWSGRN